MAAADNRLQSHHHSRCRHGGVCPLFRRGPVAGSPGHSGGEAVIAGLNGAGGHGNRPAGSKGTA